MPNNASRAYPINGAQVLSLSEQKGMTIDDLAKKVEVNPRNVRGWVLKGKPVYIRHIIKLASVLNATWERDDNNRIVFVQKSTQDSNTILLVLVIPGSVATTNKALVDRLIADAKKLAALTGNSRNEGMSDGNSVRVYILLSRDDADLLILALLDGKLIHLQLLYITVPGLLGDDKIYNAPLTVENITEEPDEPGTQITRVEEAPAAKPEVRVTPVVNDLATKRQQAEKWVNGYTAAGVAAVAAGAIIPGSATVTLLAIEASMILHIGKIYDHTWGVGSGAASFGVLGAASMIGKIAALEAAILLGPFAFIAKPAIAAAIIKTMGQLIIDHFESRGRGAATENKPDNGGSPQAQQNPTKISHK